MLRNVSKLFSLVSICAIFLISSCSKDAPLGSKDNPVKLYFTPSIDAETISTNSQTLLKFLETETGLYFISGIPTSYIAVVEAFGSKRADIAVMNSFGYLLANSKYEASAKLTTIRYGVNYYQGQIITRADSGINSLNDLQGKSFAFTDSSSTSGYLFPLKMLKDSNVTLGNQTFAMKHDTVVTMVYQKQVQAGATYYSAPSESGEIRDARARVMTQFPDVATQVKILATTEKIPNDPFVFRKDLPKDVEEKFIKALMKFLETEEGKKTFETIYSVSSVVPAQDSDYDGLRAMIKTLGVDVSSLIK